MVEVTLQEVIAGHVSAVRAKQATIVCQGGHPVVEVLRSIGSNSAVNEVMDISVVLGHPGVRGQYLPNAVSKDTVVLVESLLQVRTW